MTKNEFGQIIGEEVKNWQGAKIPPKNLIVGSHCILEPLIAEKHGSQLFEARNPASLWTYLPYGPFNTKSDFDNHLQQIIATSDNLAYAIIDPKNHQVIGMACYMRINPEHGTMEIGHLFFSQKLQKTIAATESMYLMMKRAFDDLNYRRYEWKCNSLNQGSINAAKRLGFKFEGIFRQHFIFKDRNRDTAWFSIIDSEWPEIKSRFLKWLDPKNFDSNGNQYLSLGQV